VAVRDPVAAAFLKPMGEVGQIVPVKADISDPDSLARATAGADTAINLVGILYQRGRRNFEAIHVEGARRVAETAGREGVSRLVHVSALGADPNSPAAYARSKAAGEQAVLAAFPAATIMRPSVVFGPEDDFFNRFAAMALWSPVLPMFCGDCLKPKFDAFPPRFDIYGSGGPKFQPVYVGDVAAAIMAALDDPDSRGAIMETVIDQIRRRRFVLPLPFWVGSLQAIFLQMLPKPMLTTDQVKLLLADNVAGGELPGLTELGISPTPAEAILPTYMTRYRPPASAVG
jgi:NADH dehydrogenase